jgi:hypothetical protein
MSSLVLVPLPAPVPDLGEDDVHRVRADAAPGYPCRRCLQDADLDEEMLLISYDPFLGSSPYRQPGPVYLHARPCRPDGSLALADGIPEQLARRQLSVRGFDVDHLMVTTTITPGTSLLEAAEDLFGEPRVDYLHVHNAGPGCFAVRIDRKP